MNVKPPVACANPLTFFCLTEALAFVRAGRELCFIDCRSVSVHSSHACCVDSFFSVAVFLGISHLSRPSIVLSSVMHLLHFLCHPESREGGLFYSWCCCYGRCGTGVEDWRLCGGIVASACSCSTSVVVLSTRHCCNKGQQWGSSL
jgi:hypothetical protein